jgi:hypothetical protein
LLFDEMQAEEIRKLSMREREAALTQASDHVGIDQLPACLCLRQLPAASLPCLLCCLAA